MTERILRVNGVDLRVATFGTPADPAVLLLFDATGSTPSWADGFCARLADGGRYAIRYDHRDPGPPGDGVADPAADAVGVLDALAVRRANLVGSSAGDGLARRVALDHADRAASLTLIATSPDAPGHGEVMARLPLPEDTGHELWHAVVQDVVARTGLAKPDRDEVLARIRRLGSVDAGTAFERLYAAAARGEVDVPWQREEPHQLILDRFKDVDGAGKRALVVGAGYGQDAGFLAGLGFDTVGFDISPTAVAVAAERFPAARFAVADLLDPPAEWTGAFDVVVEVLIAQALPADVRPTAIANMRRFVAPGGVFVLLSHARDDDEPPPAGPPWPLLRAEVESYADDDLRAVLVDRTGNRWWAEFRRAIS